MREKITIVYGGAFNPPTRAHEAIIQTLLERLPVERLIIVPVGSRYDKEALASFEHRFAMLKALYQDDPAIDISAIEQQDTVFQGTVHTLDTLHAHYKVPLYYVIGADHLTELQSWIESERLLSTYRFIVFNRHRQNLYHFIETNAFLKQYKLRFICLEDVDFPEASTVYRETLNSDVVSQPIASYIQHHRLYEKE